MILASNNRTSPIIVTGFALVLLTFMALAAVWLSTQEHQHARLLKIETFREAAKSIGNMRQAALRRSVLLHEMSLLKDYFDKNAKLEEFNDQAGLFILARENLLSLDLDRDDRALWEEVRVQVKENSKEQLHVAHLFMQEKYEAGRALLTENVLPKQQQVMRMLSSLFESHNLHVANEFKSAELEQQQTYRIIASLLGLALLTSIGIIYYVVITTGRIQKDLLKADEARVANQMKSDFLANMSHEIRTPLTSIIGYSDAALNPGQSREQRMDGIRTIRRNGQHLLTLINEILDLSKVEAGKMEIETLEVSIIDVLNDIADIVSIRLCEKELEWGINYIYPLPSTIQTDPVRLRQILLNLVNNAIKFTRAGYVYINVRCDQHQKRIFFEIEDTGIGITDVQASRVFDSFTQADKSTTREYGGTGLGLALSRRLSRMLGGDISLKSTPGIGSTFTVSIDTGEIDQNTIIYQSDQVKSSVDRKTLAMPILEGKVLLVDDLEDNRKLVAYLIEKTGAQVDVATNGQQAIDMSKFTRYDLVLMDMQMPVMDGLTATTVIREKGSDVPIVMLTANAYASDRQKCEQAGATGFLTKPLDTRKLNATLVKYLHVCDIKEEKLNPVYSSLLQEEPGLVDIVNRFVLYLPRQIEDIEVLCNNAEWGQLLAVLHDLKGTSGNMGFAEVYDCVVSMENILRAEQYGELKIQLSYLRKLAGVLDTRVSV